MWGFEPVVELVDQVEFLVEAERQGIPEKHSGPVDQSITCSLSYDIGRNTKSGETAPLRSVMSEKLNNPND